MERRLLSILLPPGIIPSVLGEASINELATPFDAYDAEWNMVSHTITVVDAGVLMTVLVERPTSAPDAELTSSDLDLDDHDRGDG